MSDRTFSGIILQRLFTQKFLPFSFCSVTVTHHDNYICVIMTTVIFCEECHNLEDSNKFGSYFCSRLNKPDVCFAF